VEAVQLFRLSKDDFYPMIVERAIAESGSYAELIKAKGLYYYLVSQQLS
jgi:hypothetical protein